MTELKNIVRDERSTTHFRRPQSFETGALKAWDYFMDEEERAGTNRLPALMFYGRTDKYYWFMMFRNREIVQATTAQIKMAQPLKKRRRDHEKTVSFTADQTMLADAREALFYVADQLEMAAELKEAREENPHDKRKNHLANSPPADFSRAQAWRLTQMARKLG